MEMKTWKAKYLELRADRDANEGYFSMYHNLYQKYAGLENIIQALSRGDIVLANALYAEWSDMYGEPVGKWEDVRNETK